MTARQALILAVVQEISPALANLYNPDNVSFDEALMNKLEGIFDEHGCTDEWFSAEADESEEVEWEEDEEEEWEEDEEEEWEEDEES